MTTPTASIRDLKKGFISSQLRTLSTPIEPPRSWQSQLPESPAGDLPDSVVAQALYKCIPPSPPLPSLSLPARPLAGC